MKHINRLWGHIWLIVIAVLLLGLAVGAAIMASVTGANGDPLEMLESLSAIARNIGLVVIAVPALWLAWHRTQTASRQADISNRQAEISNAQAATANKQAQISESGLIIDRFQKGAQMLESEKLDVRFAGIYALSDLALSNPDETYITVQTLLCDFIRERSKNREPDFSKVTKAKPNPGYAALPPDLEKAINAFSVLRQEIRCSEELERNASWRPDLTGAKLAHASLFGRNISSADLTGADLFDADMYEADLSNASLTRANLSNVDLTNAKLNCASLTGANLTNAEMDYAVLKSAAMSAANLTGADLHRADLSNARLIAANLSAANLSGALLTETHIFSAWVEKGCPAIGITELPLDSFGTRQIGEPWKDFIDRIMRQRPELNWTEGLKD